MVRCDRISIPDAYIIDELEERKRQNQERDGLLLPLGPFNVYDLFDLPKPIEEVDEYQSRVIIIEL